MKELTSHKVNECNGSLTVQAVDEPGSGGAHHHYRITGFNSASNPSDPFVARYGAAAEHSTILFQNGPIKEAGVNGITNEVLLAIVLDRLEGFQTGPYKCRENALAITKIEEAMHWLAHRTRLREQRGVEGTHTV